MLKLVIPTSLLLLLPLLNKKNYWLTTMLFFFLLSFLTLLITPMHGFHMFSVSSNIFLDYLSLPIILLTFWVTGLMFMASYKIIITNNNTTMFSITVILLTLSLLFCFSAANMLMFYIFFEMSLLPTMVLILLWGNQPERLQATFYFLLYTITASLPLLLSISMLAKENNSLSFLLPLFQIPLTFPMKNMWWMMTCAAFLVKMPMFSTHLWLPKAHVEAPVAGSMVLAAILLKLGSYGMLRMTLIFPSATLSMMPPIMSISMIGACVTSMICLRQPDMKSLIAYSSVGHMGLLLASLSTVSSWGMDGVLLMTIAHGLSSAAMFAMANMLYEVTYTRSLFITKGILTMMPSLSLWMFLVMAANMAAPPTINLMSEIVLLIAILSTSNMMTPLIVISSFITGAYSLILYSLTNHGSPVSYMNATTPMYSRMLLLLMLHVTPMFSLILTPDLLMFM